MKESDSETSGRGQRERPTALVRAVTYLARSLVPEARLRRYLADKEYENAEIDETVERLKAEGYLNEKSLAESRVRVLAERRGYWGSAITARMKKDGFSEESRVMARELIETAHAPAELALAGLARRYGERWWETPERRMASWLERHGFPAAVIVALLQKRRELRGGSGPESRT